MGSEEARFAALRTLLSFCSDWEFSVNTIVVAKRERPISAPVKIGLTLLLALLTLLYFPLCVLALLMIACVFPVTLLLALVALRFGQPEAALPPMRRIWRLALVILSTFRSPREGAKYHITLTEAEAPHLFQTVQECARRVGCATPDSIALEMTTGAWVSLAGYRSNRGKSTLGLGFNLLAGLEQEEIEAIILHEMAHALLVQRGIKKLGFQGVSRVVRLVEETNALIERESPERGELWSGFWTAQLLVRIGGLIAAAGARLYALYSRQDEFDADRSSATLCGGGTFGAALLKCALLDYRSAELSWYDCIMQSQREGSYTAWLRSKLRIQDEKELEKLRRAAIDQDRRSHYSFHPTIEDRIAQVNATATPLMLSFPPTPPVPWFRDSDATGERLFSLIERAQMEEERAESESLSRWERKRHIKREPNVQEIIGLGILILGAVVFLVSLINPGNMQPMEHILTLVVGLALVAISIPVYRLGTPPEPDMLPIPEFSLFEDSLEKIWTARRGYKQDLQPNPPIGGPSSGADRAERLRYWNERGQTLLQQCDYHAALSCGLQALQAAPTNLDGMLIAGIAYNCLGQEAPGDRCLSQALQMHPRSTAVRWATGWACLATGNWIYAEAYLLGVVDKAPEKATCVAALAIAQAQRGNVRQAIENMRHAVKLEPGSMRLRLRLVQYLLMAGKARDAAPEIEAIEKFPNAQTDRDVQIALVRLNLMLNHKERADEQAKITVMQHPEPHTFYRLGVAYTFTDHFEDATAYYHHATANALYPMAWVQLGFLHEKADRKTEALACFLGALNLFHPIAAKADSQFDVLDAALAGIRGLRPPSPTLFLWEVLLDVRQLPAFQLKDLLLLILAPNQQSAVNYATEIFSAMHPGGPAIDMVLRHAQRADIEPPDSATEPGIVDWRGRR